MPYRRDVLSVAALSPVAAIASPVSTVRAEERAAVAAELEALATAATSGGAGVPPPVDDAPHGPGSEPLRPAPAVATGLELAGGFRVVQAHGVRFGALPFVVEGEGERFQVDVLRRDPAGVSGVHDTNQLSFFVAEGATVLTAPARVRGARALAAALERRIAAGAEMPALVSFEERLAAHPGGAFGLAFDGDAPN